MAYTYDQLSKMTASQLKDLAHQHETDELQGVAMMHKDKLLPLLCNVFGIEVPHHHVEGIDKTKVKLEIRALKKKRDEILSTKEGKDQLGEIRRKIHELKRELRRHMV